MARVPQPRAERLLCFGCGPCHSTCSALDEFAGALICCRRTFPSCLECDGCSWFSEFLCCTGQLCCLADTPPLKCSTPEGHCCQLGLVFVACGVKKPESCRCEQRCCCVQAHGSLPPDDPCALALLGISCAPSCGCCTTIPVTSPLRKEGAARAAAPEVMERGGEAEGPRRPTHILSPQRSMVYEAAR